LKYIDIFVSISNEILSKNNFITSYINLDNKNKLFTYEECIKSMEEGKSIISVVPFEDRNFFSEDYVFEILLTSLSQIVIRESLNKIINKINRIENSKNKEFSFNIFLPLSFQPLKDKLLKELEEYIDIPFNISINQTSLNYYNSFLISKTLETEQIKERNGF